MPFNGEEISWRGNLRAHFPEYALEQLNAYCYHNDCTQVSVLLQMMAAFKSHDGKSIFYIRREDLVPDRRKTGKKRH